MQKHQWCYTTKDFNSDVNDRSLIKWDLQPATTRTWQVDVSERVSGRGPRSGQDVDGLIRDVVTVTQVQLRQQRHIANNEAQARVCDVQPRQPQVLHVTQLALVIQLTYNMKKKDTFTNTS